MNIPKLNNKINLRTSILRLPQLSDVLPCFILFLAGRASVIGMYPFGLAMFCSIFRKNVSYLGILTLVFAGLSCGSGIWTYKYVLGAVLFWLYSRLREDYRKNLIFSSVISGLCLFLGGLILTLYYPTGMYDFLVVCIESVLCSYFYIVFFKASMLLEYSREGSSEQELICAALALGILITGLSDIVLPLGIRLSSLITIYAILSISMHEDLAVAGCGGLAAGFICSMSSTAAVTLMGFYGLSAMAANLLKGLSKYGVALGFLGGAAITLLYVGNSFDVPISITEVVLSASLFCLTPDRIHKKTGVFLKTTLHPEIVPENIRIRDYLSEKLYRASQSFRGLQETVKANSDKRLRLYKKDMCSIFDEVTDRVCRKCPDFGRCWGENRSNSYRIVFSLLEVTETHGFCNKKNAPPEFLTLCAYTEMFLSEFAHVYELYKTGIINLGRNKTSRDLLLLQYGEISDFLAELSSDIKSGFKFLPELEMRLATDLAKLKIQAREVKVIEGAGVISDIYLSTDKNVSPEFLEEKISRLINTSVAFSERVGSMMRFCPKSIFSAEISTAQLPKDGQSVNGDNLTYFYANDHKFYVILCDGMGSGEAAEKESKIASQMIEMYLRAGFSPKMTLNMINSALVLKSDNEVFSSVDLLCIDLLSGQAHFYKTGSSKSIFNHQSTAETIFSDSLPTGLLPYNHISATTKRIDDGDIIVMMSDGVSDATPGYISAERIHKMIEKEPDDTKILSKMILNSVLKKKCGRVLDDMSVAVIKINIVDE